MSTTTESEKPKGNAPVFKDGNLALFLNTREVKQGERAGETYEVYTAIMGEQNKTPEFRYDISKRVAGYELTPDEAAALALGNEIVVDRQSKNTSIDPETGEEVSKTYTQIFGPLEPVSNTVGDKTYTRLPIGNAFAHFSKPSEEDGSIDLISFTVNALKADGTEDRESKGLESWRWVGPRTASVKVTIADAYAAREAIAKGKPFAIEHDGVTVPLKGSAPGKRANGPMRMEWDKAIFAQQPAAVSTKTNARVV